MDKEQSLFVSMNYWPKEDYWLLQELSRRNVNFRLKGINTKLRNMRFWKYGNAWWNLIRLVGAFFIALQLRKNEVVFCLDNTASSMFIASFVRIFCKKNTIVCINMMDKLTGSNNKRRLYQFAFKQLYASVNNKALADEYSKLYGLSSDRFFILPDNISNWGMNILNNNLEHESHGYIFAGGSAYRDWELFTKVAAELPQYQFVGVARRSAYANVTITPPKNLKMYFDVDEGKFQELLRHCKAIYLPISAKTQGGQIVIFQGALYHKPVITTDTIAIKSYIDNGENGLLVKLKDKDSSVKAIQELMSSENLQKKLSDNLFVSISALTPSRFVDECLQFIRNKGINL